ncbi:MAG: M14 family zinc carboxypeptidase [Planctomycetota bacterium]
MTRLLVASAVVSLAGSALAQQAAPRGLADARFQTAPTSAQSTVAQPQAAQPEAQRSVMARVDLRTQQDLLAVTTIAETFWSCRIGVGPVEVQFEAGDLATLDALGLEYEVLVEDVDRLIALERASIEELRLLRGLDWYDNYKTYPEFLAYADDLIARFGPAGTENPGLLKKEIIGQSLEGRDLFALRVNAPGATPNTKPAMLFNGGQHAREWVNPATTMYIAEQFCATYGADPQATRILDALEILVVPLINPDGYVYSWQNSGTRLWRKNRRDNGDGTRGVDLNRNWDIFHGGPGADNITSSDIYHGPAAFSEPETAALRDYLFDQNLVVGHLDIHSFSQLILWPWGYGFVSPPAEDEALLTTLGQAMAQAIQQESGVSYTPQQSVDLYPASGTCSDWFYDQGVYSYTIELRDTGSFGFVLPPEQILPTAREHFEAVLVMCDAFVDPIAVQPLSAAPVSVAPNTPFDVSFSATATYGQLDAAQSLLVTRVDGGTWNSTPFNGPAPVFSGSVPGADCGSLIEFYAQFETTDGQIVTFPADIEQSFAVLVQDSEVALFDDGESTAGWTVGAPSDTATTGVWENGAPIFTGAQPAADHTPGAGTNCWITGAFGASLGDNDVDGGATTLTSPALDTDPANSAFPGAEAFIRYYRWYSNNTGGSPNADTFQIDISDDDGATWTQLEAVTENTQEWTEATFRVADFVTPTSTVRLRFIAEDAGGGSVVEAAIDDLEVFLAGCPGTLLAADLTTSGLANGEPDGIVDLSDFSYYLSLWSQSDITADVTTTGTANGTPDTVVDLSDFSYYLSVWSSEAG